MLCDIYISLRNQKVFNIIQYLDICSVYKIIVYYFGIEIDEKLIQDINVPIAVFAGTTLPLAAFSRLEDGLPVVLAPPIGIAVIVVGRGRGRG